MIGRMWFDASVTKVGITGHRDLSARTQRLAAAAIATRLAELDGPVTAVSCLAIGADQALALAVLAAGGDLVFIEPCRRYAATFTPEELPIFDACRSMASDVIRLDFEKPTEDAFLAGGLAVVAHSDVVIAVWDGKPGGMGGTGDVVAACREQGVPVEIIWPDGARRGMDP